MIAADGVRAPARKGPDHSVSRPAALADLCRRHGISVPTLYNWKAKYGGLDVSEARRLKALEDENRRLKKLLAEQVLDNAALKDLVGKNF